MQKDKNLTDITGSCTMTHLYDDNIIVDDGYLMEVLNLSKSFINRHAKAMGSFNRPRKFFLKHVFSFLNAIAEKSLQKSHSIILRKDYAKKQVNELFNTVMKKQAMRRPKNVCL
ncbi:MAG: hypothetical protein HQK96_19130 [Nitrospirae bacterium]|nr:hypothetical protein [Nitrospirota bacterium]